jgi:hypothetical protein
MDVPDLTPGWFPEPTPVETTLTPGALISGFSAESPFRGPPDEKLTIRL